MVIYISVANAWKCLILVIFLSVGPSTMANPGALGGGDLLVPTLSKDLGQLTMNDDKSTSNTMVISAGIN